MSSVLRLSSIVQQALDPLRQIGGVADGRAVRVAGAEAPEVLGAFRKGFVLIGHLASFPAFLAVIVARNGAGRTARFREFSHEHFGAAVPQGAYLTLKGAQRQLNKAVGGLESGASITRVDYRRLSRYGSPNEALFAPVDVVADLEADARAHRHQGLGGIERTPGYPEAPGGRRSEMGGAPGRAGQGSGRGHGRGWRRPSRAGGIITAEESKSMELRREVAEAMEVLARSTRRWSASRTKTARAWRTKYEQRGGHLPKGRGAGRGGLPAQPRRQDGRPRQRRDAVERLSVRPPARAVRADAQGRGADDGAFEGGPDEDDRAQPRRLRGPGGLYRARAKSRTGGRPDDGSLSVRTAGNRGRGVA